MDRISHLLPPYLNNIEDYLSITSTNTTIRSIVQDGTSPRFLLLLSYHSRRTFFRPNPLFLLSALARPLSLWARQSTDNLRRLVESFWRGEEAVLELAISIPTIAIESKWSLAKIRELWLWRMNVANPLSDLIDKCVGEQWYDVPNFWDGGREDAATLHAEPEETLFSIIIYGELFGDAFTSGELQTPAYASIPTRIEFVKYLLPDWHTPQSNFGRDITCNRPYRDGEIHTPAQNLINDSGIRHIHSFKAVQHIGPYSHLPVRSEFQMVIIHLLKKSPLWAKITQKVRAICGGDVASDVQGLWENALYMLGREGMDMVSQVWAMECGRSADLSGEGWETLKLVREKVLGINVEKVEIGLRRTYESPHLLQDLEVAVCDR